MQQLTLKTKWIRSLQENTLLNKNDTVTAGKFANLLVSPIKKLQSCNLAFYVKMLKIILGN